MCTSDTLILQNSTRHFLKLVLDLDPNSAAALKGLRPGDVIISANDQSVKTVAQLATLAESNTKRLLLEVQRADGGDVFLVIDNN